MKKHKFTWIDGLVLAVVVLLIAGTCVKFLVRGTGKTSTEETFTYELLISGIRQVSADALQVGDAVYDNEGKGLVGTITDISISPAETNITLTDGSIQRGTIEERYDVVLTISAEGSFADGHYQTGTYDIQVNQVDTYFTKYSIWSATVLSVGDEGA